MSNKSLAIQNAQRAAFERLANKFHVITKTEAVKQVDGSVHNLPVRGANGMPVQEAVGNPWAVKPDNITCPSLLAQELQLDGTTNTLSFIFNQNSPPKDPTHNNVNLGVNDIFCMYGVQVLFGVGANGNTRQYFTHGLIPADNAIYQGAEMSMQFEQSETIKNIDMTDFRYDETTDFKPEEAIKLINPLRLLTGRLGTFTVKINMQALTGLVFTPNAWVRVSLQGVLGQASGTN